MSRSPSSSHFVQIVSNIVPQFPGRSTTEVSRKTSRAKGRTTRLRMPSSPATESANRSAPQAAEQTRVVVALQKNSLCRRPRTNSTSLKGSGVNQRPQGQCDDQLAQLSLKTSFRRQRSGNHWRTARVCYPPTLIIESLQLNIED